MTSVSSPPPPAPLCDARSCWKSAGTGCELRHRRTSCCGVAVAHGRVLTRLKAVNMTTFCQSGLTAAFDTRRRPHTSHRPPPCSSSTPTRHQHGQIPQPQPLQGPIRVSVSWRPATGVALCLAQCQSASRLPSPPCLLSVQCHSLPAPLPASPTNTQQPSQEPQPTPPPGLGLWPRTHRCPCEQRLWSGSPGLCLRRGTCCPRTRRQSHDRPAAGPGACAAVSALCVVFDVAMW